MKKSNVSKNDTEALYAAIRQLVYDSKAAIAIAVNQQLSLLYWNIGKCIKNEILQNKRAGYGKHVIGTLSQKLTTEFGKGWSKQ